MSEFSETRSLVAYMQAVQSPNLNIVKGKEIGPLIGKLYQSTSEDSDRHCNKPQIVWFLIG